MMDKSHADLKASWGLKEEPKSATDKDADTLADRLAAHSISDQ